MPLGIEASAAAEPHLPDAGFARTIRIRPARTDLWLGQSVGITVQLVDASGRGVPGVPLTCVTSWGTLAGRSGFDQQRGASVALLTRPGGIVRFELAAPLAPPPNTDERAALEADLSLLPPDAARLDEAYATLEQLAARYRADGSEILRRVVDRLLAAFPTEPSVRGAPWPLIPVTLIAVAGAEGEMNAMIDRVDAVAIGTIRVRNWLGAWLTALRNAITSDKRIGTLLGNLPVKDLTGPEIARSVLGATRALAALERGSVGRNLLDAAANNAVNRFVAGNSEQVQAAALVDVVRAAGASNTVIASGGFAVFDAIETVQDVQGSIAGRKGVNKGLFDSRFGVLEERFTRFEERAVDRGALDQLRDTFDATLTARFAAVQANLDGLSQDRVTEADLAALEGRVSSGFDDRAAGIRDELTSKMNDRFAEFTRDFPSRTELSDFEGRLDASYGERVKRLESGVSDLREGQVSRADLSAIQERLDASLEERVKRLREEFREDRRFERFEALELRMQEVTTKLSALSERQVVTVNDIDALEARLSQRVNADVSAAVGIVRSELGSRLDAKADASAVDGLQRSVSGLASENQRLARRLDGVDLRFRDFNPNIRRPP